jgi:hypothetical protein
VRGVRVNGDAAVLLAAWRSGERVPSPRGCIARRRPCRGATSVRIGYGGGIAYITGRTNPSPTTHSMRFWDGSRDHLVERIRLQQPILLDSAYWERILIAEPRLNLTAWRPAMRLNYYTAVDRPLFKRIAAGCSPVWSRNLLTMPHLLAGCGSPDDVARARRGQAVHNPAYSTRLYNSRPRWIFRTRVRMRPAVHPDWSRLCRRTPLAGCERRRAVAANTDRKTRRSGSVGAPTIGVLRRMTPAASGASRLSPRSSQWTAAELKPAPVLQSWNGTVKHHTKAAANCATLSRSPDQHPCSCRCW